MAKATAVRRSEAPDIARQYADYIQNEIHIIGVYLFGSHVNGNIRADSDIDIAVVSDSFTGDPVEDQSMLLLLKSNVDNRIEPHPFLPSDFTEDNPLAREIMETSIRIA
jgi:predicted nucleotidyltransferase